MATPQAVAPSAARYAGTKRTHNSSPRPTIRMTASMTTMFRSSPSQCRTADHTLPRGACGGFMAGPCRPRFPVPPSPPAAAPPGRAGRQRHVGLDLQRLRVHDAEPLVGVGHPDEAGARVIADVVGVVEGNTFQEA